MAGWESRWARCKPASVIVPTVALPPIVAIDLPNHARVRRVRNRWPSIGWAAPGCTATDAGEIPIVTCGGVTVTTAEADFVESASETAVTVTVDGLGTADGALYRPAAVIVPMVAFPPTVPFTCQTTPRLARIAHRAAELPRWSDGQRGGSWHHGHADLSAVRFGDRPVRMPAAWRAWSAAGRGEHRNSRQESVSRLGHSIIQLTRSGGFLLAFVTIAPRGLMCGN